MVRNANTDHREPIFSEEIRLPGLRVLLVSDEGYLNGAKSNISREYGCECHGAGSMIDALWKLADNEYDLVAIDSGLIKDSINSIPRYPEILPRIKQRLGIAIDPKDPELIGGVNTISNGCRLGGLLVKHGVLTKYNLVFLTGGHQNDVAAQLGNVGLNGCDVLSAGGADIAMTLRESLIMAFAFKSDGSLKSTQRPGLTPAVPGRKAFPRKGHLSAPPMRASRSRAPR